MPFGAHSSFPRAILHIDGDAFFASCEQSLNFKLKGKPVVTGKERGIASSISYEAKAQGATRGMSLAEIKKLIPQVIIIPSDYETYSLLSKRFYSIVRRYTSDLEEYGIDECFADITGMRRPLHSSYRQIAEKIDSDLTRELGFTFSIGLAPTKVLAKVASKWNKPHGLTLISARTRQDFLRDLPAGNVWGIGPQTTALLAKYGITTALAFAERPEAWVRKHFSKPFIEIWQELNGISVMSLLTDEHETYYSIQKMKTFTPPSSERTFVLAQLSKNIENACIKARRHHQAAKEVVFVLRTQEFKEYAISAKLTRASAYPNEIIKVLEDSFDDFFDPTLRYRMTGVVLLDLTTDDVHQMDLFGASVRAEKLSYVYKGMDELAGYYGKHVVYLASSFQAHNFSQHLGARGDAPRRMTQLFKDETKRRRLGIPMFSGSVD